MVLLSLCWQIPTTSELFSGEEGKANDIVVGNRLDTSQKNFQCKEIIVLMLEPLHHLLTDFSVRPEFTLFIPHNN
jgi:hypothetical protein